MGVAPVLLRSKGIFFEFLRFFVLIKEKVRKGSLCNKQGMGSDSDPNDTVGRRDQELFYIWAFPTLQPAGINVFV